LAAEHWAAAATEAVVAGLVQGMAMAVQGVAWASLAEVEKAVAVVGA